MNKAEAKEILDGIIKKYRSKSYDELAALIDDDIGSFRLKGESGADYEVEIDIFWDAKCDTNICVNVVIDTGIISSFFPMQEQFIKNSRNEFVEESYENPLF